MEADAIDLAGVGWPIALLGGTWGREGGKEGGLERPIIKARKKGRAGREGGAMYQSCSCRGGPHCTRPRPGGYRRRDGPNTEGGWEGRREGGREGGRRTDLIPAEGVLIVPVPVLVKIKDEMHPTQKKEGHREGGREGGKKHFSFYSPILFLPSESSLYPSTSWWKSNTRCARSEMRKRPW